MRLALITIAVILLLVLGGFVALLVVAEGLEPADEEIRIELEDNFEN